MVVYSWENHLFLWAIYTMAMLVITRWYRNSFSHDVRRLSTWQVPATTRLLHDVSNPGLEQHQVRLVQVLKYHKYLNPMVL